jgi:hypothetical protein
MSSTTLVKTARTVVASVSRAAADTPASPTFGRLNLTTAQGGILTMKITNSGALGAQCVGTVLIAHNASLPAAAVAGADWKTLWSFGGGLVSGTVTEQSMTIDPGVMHLEVMFNGNTTNAAVVEAYFSEITSADTA